jgi:AbrB family looped-hinge helix DNA binding protein
MLPAEVRNPDLPDYFNETFFMSSTARIQHKGQVTIPTRVREQAGLNKGDVVEFSYQRGKIVITPKVIIDRSQFSTADDEYTPAQRRIIDARLDKADKDIKAGRTRGPFTAKQAVAYIERLATKGRRTKTSKRPRR